MFNSKILILLLKIAQINTEQGINNFTDFLKKIKPWIKPAWNMTVSYQGNDLDEKILAATFQYVGSKWQNEAKSLDEIKNDIEELVGKEEAKPYMKYFDIAHIGVRTYFIQEEYYDANIWKNKYEELNKKYIKTHDEVIYLRRAYDKEHAKLISLENELEISHKKIIELQKNNMQRYRKEDIDNINDWRKFEQFVAKQFKRKNFKVILTPRTNDGGKDIIINKNGIKTYVECKYWNSNKSIGREEIQKLAGAAMMDGVKNAIFITTSTYNENAFETAKALNKNGFNIKLWTTNDLLVFINE